MEFRDLFNEKQEDILKNKIKINLPLNMVYFLIDDNKIVYVGHTTRGLYRLFEHHHANKIFNAYYYIECDKNDLRGLERHYIRKFKPKYNLLEKDDIC